jgi:hypothetical protein
MKQGICRRLLSSKLDLPLLIRKKPFVPKKSESSLTDITTGELNIGQRAKERKEFNTVIKAENKN